MDAKWESFGWHVLRVDGHDTDALYDAYGAAKAYRGKPTVILAHTVKGKGVSYMENQVGWHGSAPNTEQYEQAISELDALLSKLEVE